MTERSHMENGWFERAKIERLRGGNAWMGCHAMPQAGACELGIVWMCCHVMPLMSLAGGRELERLH